VKSKIKTDRHRRRFRSHKYWVKRLIKRLYLHFFFNGVLNLGLQRLGNLQFQSTRRFDHPLLNLECLETL
jgi:hypothetical protein